MQTSSIPEKEIPYQEEPWQLKMFQRSLKKQQKLNTLLRVIGNVQEKKCLLITCGDNNGALNWHFKQHGGEWSWADAEPDSIEQINQLTGDRVAEMDKENPELPYLDESFDIVMTIDVHEHLKSPLSVNRELVRLVKPGGTVIVSTPNGNKRKLANRLKILVGMRPEDYGHVVMGYDIPDLEQQLRDVNLNPYISTSYSRFFTEFVELLINFLYVKVLSKRSKAKVEKGQIAPLTQEQLNSVGKTYKMYSVIYPFFLAFSKLDALVSFRRGYAVVVAARKE